MVDQPEMSMKTHGRKRNYQVCKNVSAVSVLEH